MVRVKYLWKHTGSGMFHYRRTLPPDVQARLGKTILINLRTRHEWEAVKLVVPLIEKTNREIAEARSGRKFNDAELERISIEWGRYYQESILNARTATLPDEIQFPASTEAELDESILKYLLLTDYKIKSVDPDFQRLRELCFEEHYYTYAVRPPLTRLKEMAPDFLRLEFNERGFDDSPLRISAVLAAYNAARNGGPGTSPDRDVAVARFVELFGDKPIPSIAKADAREFRTLAAQVPKTMPNDVRQKPLRAQIEWGKAHGANPIGPASLNKQLSMLRSLIQWARNDGGLLDELSDFQNPFDGVQVRDDRVQEEKRVPFTIDNLNAIFGAEWFRTAQDENRWLPLLALYTGARLEELGQLLLEDIRRQDEVNYLAITPVDERGNRAKRLKTVGAKRDVPIHPSLIRLGFLRYVEAQRKARRDRLFSNLKPGSDGKLTPAYSKRVNRHLAEIVPDKRKRFHSLRHNFKQESIRVMMPEQIQERR